MPVKTYYVDGKKHTFELGESGTNEEGNRYQEVIIDGQKMKLYVDVTLDNYRGEDGYSVHMEIVPDKKNLDERHWKIVKTGSNGGRPRYGYEYIGPSRGVIYNILEQRTEKGEATRLEKVAVFQNEYNLAAEAENDVKPDAQDRGPKYLNLTKEQIDGKKPLPNLKKRFPWHNSDKDDGGWLDQSRAFLGNKDAKYRVAYRALYNVRRENFTWFNEHTGRAHDGFLGQNDTQAPVDENFNMNDNNDRFMARVDKRAEQAAEQAATQTQEKPNPTRRRVSRTPSPRDDGYGMA